jgi:hypothetical protein
MKSPDLEVDQLVSMEDLTSRVAGSVKSGNRSADAAVGRF